MGRGGKRDQFRDAIASSLWSLSASISHSASPGPSVPSRRVLPRRQSDSVLASVKDSKEADDSSCSTSVLDPSSRARQERTENTLISTRSKSPTYLMNAKGERTIRRSHRMAEELETQKAERRNKVDVSVKETIGSSSIGSETRTTAASSMESSDSSSLPEGPFSFYDDEKKSHENTPEEETQSQELDGEGAPRKKEKKKKKKKKERRASLGAGCTLAEALEVDSPKQKKKKKEKKEHHRNKSVGASPRKSSREARATNTKDTHDIMNGLNELMLHLSSGDDKSKPDSRKKLLSVPWTSESVLKDKDVSIGDGDDQSISSSVRSSTSSTRQKHKYRTTVDQDGKIRRGKTDSHEGSDGEGDNSRVSKRSKAGSVRSSKSSKSKKSLSSRGSARGKEKKEMKKKRSKEDDDCQEGGTSATSNTSGSGDMDECSRESLTKPRVVRDDDVVTDCPTFLEPNVRHNRDKILNSPSTLSRIPIRPDLWDNRRRESFTSQISEKSMNVPSHLVVDINTVKTADLQMEIDKLKQELLVLKGERNSGLEEAAIAKRELREAKLELQKSQTERRELRAEVQEQEEIIREKNQKILALEKAVESQLDKMDELEEEVHRADEEIAALEERLARWESHKGVSNEVGKDSERRNRLEERLEKKEKDLDMRERALKEENNLLVGRLQSRQELEKLEKDNKMILTALTREKEESMCLLLAKDIEIDELKKQLARSKLGGGGGGNSWATSSASADLQRKTDTIDILQQQIAKLQQELNRHDSRDSAGSNQDLEAVKAEASILKSKFEGAQRRNQILEDDIDHWKSVNCNLEDELADWKSQALTWKSRYESASSNGGLSSPMAGRIGELHRPARSAARISMLRKDDEEDVGDNKGDLDSSQISITSLWSKLTKSNSLRSLNASTHSARSREETANKAIFS